MSPAPMRVPAHTARELRDSASAPASLLAALAVQALIEEAQLTPKPALVDRRGSGAHRDLDLARMLRSAHALEPTFAALARATRGQRPSATLRSELAALGRAGEITMMAATNGSNAHRGAIWIIGLLVAGATIAHDTERAWQPRSICAYGARIACFPDYAAPLLPADSNGARVRQRYGVGGARREAQDGFPHVIEHGLPALEAARRRGHGENAARIDALLAIMVSLDDTCLLHRAGPPALEAAQRGAREVLACGGSASLAGRAALYRLDRRLVAMNASPGGAADLLAATLFIDKLVRYGTGRSPDEWSI